MQKKLTPEQQDKILSAATEEFGRRGLSDAAIQRIADNAGVSVGVIYKYYADKSALFEAAVSDSIRYLENALGEAAEAGSLLESARALIRAVRRVSRERPECIRLYHEITAAAHQDMSREMAERIESATAGVYKKLIAEARSQGTVNDDRDAAMLAFFFDNLLMMLHFSCTCDYYIERFRIYCGDDILDPKYDEMIENKMLEFIDKGME